MNLRTVDEQIFGYFFMGIGIIAYFVSLNQLTFVSKYISIFYIFLYFYTSLYISALYFYNSIVRYNENIGKYLGIFTYFPFVFL